MCACNSLKTTETKHTQLVVKRAKLTKMTKEEYLKINVLFASHFNSILSLYRPHIWQPGFLPILPFFALYLRSGCWFSIVVIHDLTCYRWIIFEWKHKISQSSHSFFSFFLLPCKFKIYYNYVFVHMNTHSDSRNIIRKNVCLLFLSSFLYV